MTPNTITAYKTFVANTRARATDVNTNFSNHRGDLIPINSDTATASDNAHDLGTSEHRWRRGYIENIYGQSALTVNIDGADCATFTSDGLTRQSIKGYGAFVTSTGTRNNFVISELLNDVKGTSTATDWTGASVTISGVSSTVFQIGLMSFELDSATAYSYVRLEVSSTMSGHGYLSLYRGSTLIKRSYYSRIGNVTGAGGFLYLAPESISWYDVPNTSGSVTYKLQHVVGDASLTSWSLINVHFFARAL